MAVYFIRSTGPKGEVKIGYTGANPEGRLKTLQTGCPDVLVLDYVISDADASYEHLLHERFAKYRTIGEWFIYDEEIVDFVESHKLHEEYNRKADIRRSEAEHFEFLGEIYQEQQERAYEAYLEKLQEKEYEDLCLAEREADMRDQKCLQES